MFSQIEKGIFLVLSVAGLSFVTCLASAKSAVTEPPVSQVLGVRLHLEIKTVEDYDGYGSSVDSSGKTVQQYFGDSVKQTLTISGSARLDSMTVDLKGSIPVAAQPSIKAVDVETDKKGNHVYHFFTPKSADYAFLGNNKELKAACFQHMDPSLSIWRSK
ncbi:MAG: hypothetical protein K2X47_18255, partial [Bdellovibrionales bacterium]|nr:hypothetical protein [Bdellovibrionales bacterium]